MTWRESEGAASQEMGRPFEKKGKAMRGVSAYAQLGIGLIVGGAIATPVFFFVAQSVPLTAFGLSAILLGVISLLLSRSLPKVPPQAAQLLLEAGLDNLSGLLEEIGVHARAVYLPSRLTGGKSKALIPLHANPSLPEISKSLTDRVIVDFGPGPEDVAMLVTTPGTVAMGFLDSPPGASSAELEAALAKVLHGALDLATSLQVSQEPGLVTMEAAGLRFEHQPLPAYRQLGTPVASVAAAIVAEGMNRPVRILSEDRTGDRLVVRLEVLP